MPRKTAHAQALPPCRLGGLGGPDKVSYTPEQTYRAEIERIVKASSAVLDAGGSADDAMEATILLMENSMSRASLSSSQGR
eukprot:COSAG06_NODE_3910_length_4781_cov_15.115984_3_plen_81_part_00